ncbi:hypothetical protein M4I93_01165 [Enterococcus faecium]|uniref:hypothetical protein n=1 Tax=Enterococcus faecium TaxID=1352 RepID=UPI000DE982F9|nr:hypothetical protein [Enterococcus faecium]EGP5440362.1 hypothetical protein [Enterococcus faecium]EGP5549525.1 hypothetical protein [Enterococcus faecium]MDK4376638.1 hypothetical protein [Enterococcus faecium]HAQ0367081.1 hypothetical protein [Enterococcus faecium]HAR8796463.1 hypothetical protein [Enterococcus faecium]
MEEKKIKGAGILLVMSKALFLLPCTFMFIVLCYFKRRKKWCWIDVLLFLPFFPLIYFLEEIWDDMACDSAFLFSHSLGLMISLTIFAIVLFFLNKK